MQPLTDSSFRELLPDAARVENGELVLGGVRSSELAREFGTPRGRLRRGDLRAQARAYTAAAPGALVVYGTKAFPSVAVLRLFVEEGLGADVSTLGELEFAARAGLPGEPPRDPRQQQGRRAAPALGRARGAHRARLARRARARACDRRTALPDQGDSGIEADTHEAVKTAHHGSKFGLPPDDAIEALRRLPGCLGLHVHVGSQLMHFGAALMTVDWVAQFAARARLELGWTPGIVDLGGGLGVRHVVEEPSFTVAEFVGGLVGELGRAFHLQSLPAPSLVLEPGRSLVSRAGVTLYTVGVVKRASAATTYVTIDGGMSDNPRPAMYGARYTALLANRAAEYRRPHTPSPASTANRATC